MDRSVARLNIQHYKRLLATESDEERRQTLLRLLAEEETKLAAAKLRDQIHRDKAQGE